MIAQVIRHVDFEGLGQIEDYLSKHQIDYRESLMFKQESLPEIGWFDIEFEEEFLDYVSTSVVEFNSSEKVFQWHGDTFLIPEGAIPIANSSSGIEQGFIYNNVLALQFQEEIFNETSFFKKNKALLFQLLDFIIL